ncbi:MAG TPA: DUF1579 family protein [Candidatus Binatia bacterium]|nr:DUF1579 family protein [Candidatus Binatia bacterium]
MARKLTQFSAVLVLCCGFAASAWARAQESAPKPGAEHKKLDALVGSWSVEGEVKPNPMGPGGKMSESEKCEWMDGDFFVVCHVDFKSANSGNGTGLSVIGYSTADKSYTYREFNSWGESMDSRGSVDGDTWTWTNDEKMGDTLMHTRFIMKFTSPSVYTFTYDTSPDGDKWTTIVEGKASKAK